MAVMEAEAEYVGKQRNDMKPWPKPNALAGLIAAGDLELYDLIGEKMQLWRWMHRAAPRGISKYREPVQTGWKPPLAIRHLEKEECAAMRRRRNILVEGEDIPPPMMYFEDMRFPKPVVEILKAKGIMQPTPLQVQGLPVVLSGRDMIGVAVPGSGKTLVFVLPLVMFALQEELRMPLIHGEGPIGLVIGLTPELAQQAFEVVGEVTSVLAEKGFPRVRSILCTGGGDVRSQVEVVEMGVHVVVATLGRLKEMLHMKKMNLDNCQYLVLDDADRLLNLGYGLDIREVVERFKGPRQTVLFTATMPESMQEFVKDVLVKPVVVNVSGMGAASLNVYHEVERVKKEGMLVLMLKCLQKTLAPVVIFCQNDEDVDHIRDYLVLKGVKAVAIHGGQAQEERDFAICAFKAGNEDVLVATDVASEGLDFPDIQHVINYDMPAEIEKYFRRIGRAGRCRETGIATSFVDKSKREENIWEEYLQRKIGKGGLCASSLLDGPMEVEEVAKASGVKGFTH